MSRGPSILECCTDLGPEGGVDSLCFSRGKSMERVIGRGGHRGFL